MTSSLQLPAVHAVLERLHEAAAGDDDRESSLPRPAERTLPPSALERAEESASIYMPISREAGRLCYALVRAIRPATIVEFGTSFGISTLYLAAAVSDNASGHILTTELSADKVRAARENLRAAGLDAAVDVLEGDARVTLTESQGPIGLVLLDGWKDLYLPVLGLLEPRLVPGALVIADDSSFESVKPYLAYVRDPANGYESVGFPVEDGMEISCRTAPGNRPL
jgi:predicted O-methyltransferase YrrM